MAVGILIITHEHVGQALLDTAINTLSFCPLDAAVINVACDCDIDKITASAKEHWRKLQTGDGVLIMTDIFGSTPSNIACALQTLGRCVVVAGINLPMLIRVLNYPHLTLSELVAKALSGGREGILASPEPQR
ncbi:MAG: PTS fructose transporter subunit IIA [Gammaproteobacteria bacterium]|nr:PTS fructose transporter subunit IIA [Gammaproteobacteria bacterium]